MAKPRVYSPALGHASVRSIGKPWLWAFLINVPLCLGMNLCSHGGDSFEAAGWLGLYMVATGVYAFVCFLVSIIQYFTYRNDIHCRVTPARAAAVLHGALAVAIWGSPIWMGTDSIVRQWVADWQYVRRTWLLDTTTRVALMYLPAGTVVHLSTTFDPHTRYGPSASEIGISASEVDSLELPGPTHLMGAVLNGRLERSNSAEPGWKGTLTSSQRVQGRICGSGDIVFRDDLTLYSCSDPRDGNALPSSAE